METIQLKCGNCHQLMGITSEHLGSQVQCPHCHSVVQTPSRQQAPPAKSPVMQAEPKHQESIFGGPESSDDLFGAPTLSSRDERREPEPSSRPTAEPTIAFEAPPESSEPEPPRTENAQTDLTRFKRRPLYDKSMASLMVMIVLVPYSIVTTLLIVYLLATQNRTHPLDMLPDPAPSKKQGAPRPALQTIHNYPLAKHQKTTLGIPVRIGDIEVTPENIHATAEGDLQLRLRARNVSAASAFEPINDFFVRYRPSKDRDGDESRPYTFLESKTRSVDNLYGGYLEYRKKSQGKEDLAGNTVLGPREEAIILLTTMENYHLQVASILKSQDRFLWRVQVRRGQVRYQGKDVSVTAVIGVEFTPQQIERDTKKT